MGDVTRTGTSETASESKAAPAATMFIYRR
jgi:hypothetical protein